MTAITPFNFAGCEVRSIADEDGQPWFVGKDVCRALEHTNHNKALGRLPVDERKGVTISYPLGGPQMTTIINEPGVYRLIVTSRVPAAERFKHWLVHEVLPALRKTGRYQMPGSADPLGDVPEETARLWLGLIRESRIIGGIKAAKLLWAQSPLPPLPEVPAIVQDDSGMAEVSVVREFLQECTEADPAACIAAAKLYAAYTTWCGEANERAASQNRFGRVAGALGHPRMKRGVTYYLGLKLVG